MVGLEGELVGRAARHVEGVVRLALEHPEGEPALVVADRGCELARVLGEAYGRVLEGAECLDFDAHGPEELRGRLEAMPAGSLVVLVQSTSFRLDAFRIRIELFRRGLKVIEHPHLARMTGREAEVYVDALAYDPAYFRGVGRALKARIDGASEARICTGENVLLYPAGLEPAKLNVGDYADLPNVGGQFPIGEVFTESLDLEAVQGRVQIAYFGDTDFTVNQPPQPITLVVEDGRVVRAEDSCPAFDQVLESIRAHEGQVWLRELGFGLNRALGPDRTVRDIGTFERMCGVHLSLGAKHATYKKPQISTRSARFHVDVFVLPTEVLLDTHPTFTSGHWTP